MTDVAVPRKSSKKKKKSQFHKRVLFISVYITLIFSNLAKSLTGPGIKTAHWVLQSDSEAKVKPKHKFKITHISMDLRFIVIFCCLLFEN